MQNRTRQEIQADGGGKSKRSQQIDKHIDRDIGNKGYWFEG